MTAFVPLDAAAATADAGPAPVVPADVAERVRRRLASAGTRPDAASVALALRADGVVVDPVSLRELVESVSREMLGAGPLQPLLDDPATTDVLVNGPDEVWADRGDGLVRAPVRFRDEAAVRALAQRLAAVAGRRLDDAAPYVDGRLAHGVRLHAVLPPVSPAGTLLSLRAPARRPFTLADLVAAGTLDAPMAATLAAVVRARASVLVTGGTGSGKTTLLATLLGLCGEQERLVLVEDSGELLPAHPHVVRLEARPANVEGAGAVTLRDLVRQSLRMRPDRIVVGEVRGAEVVDLLAALNTGHEGGMATVHANAARDLPARIEALALAAGLPREAVHSQLAAGVRCVVHVRRGRGGVRQVSEIACLQRGSAGVDVVRAVRSSDGGLQEAEGADVLAALVGGRPWR